MGLKNRLSGNGVKIKKYGCGALKTTSRLFDIQRIEVLTRSEKNGVINFETKTARCMDGSKRNALDRVIFVRFPYLTDRVLVNDHCELGGMERVLS